jgi:hypothetical protein
MHSYSTFSDYLKSINFNTNHSKEKKNEVNQNKGIFYYYCNLCSNNVFILKYKLDCFPNRHHDNSYIIKSEYIINSYISKDKEVNINFNSFSESRIKYKCNKCQGYVCYKAYTEEDELITYIDSNYITNNPLNAKILKK